MKLLYAIAIITFTMMAAPAKACDCNLTCSGISDGGACRSHCSATCREDAPDYSSSSGPTDRYGAIAVNPETLAYGYSFDYETEKQAEARALKECEGECEIDFTFWNSCAALATGEAGWFVGKRWASDYGDDESEAMNMALYSCNEQGSGCEVVASVCSGN